MERGMLSGFLSNFGQQSENTAEVVLTSITITFHRVKAIDIHHVFLTSTSRDCI